MVLYTTIIPLFFFFYLEVFQLDLQVPFMVHVFLSQEDSVVVVASLPENLDGDLNIEVDLTFTALLKYGAGGPRRYNMAAIIELIVRKVGFKVKLCVILSLQPMCSLIENTKCCIHPKNLHHLTPTGQSP